MNWILSVSNKMDVCKIIIFKLLSYLVVLSYVALFYCTAIDSAYAGMPSFEIMLEDSAPGEIKVILQDKTGYMWFGGRNSLLRYDAYTYQNIQAVEQSNGQTRKVSPNYMTDMLQDSRGRIWITAHSGLYLFDPDLEILVRPTGKNGEVSSEFKAQLQSIVELPSGEFMIGGSDKYGSMIFDANTFEITWRQGDRQNSGNLSDPLIVAERTIQRFLVDRQKRIWISSNRGLSLFNYAEKTSTYYIPNPQNPLSRTDNALTTLVEDSAGNLLGGTIGKGLYLFDTQTRQFRHYMNDANNPASLPDDAIWKIMVDSEGKIWVTHSLVGFSWFDEKTEKFTRFNYAYGRPGTPPSASVRTIFEDENQNIWIGCVPGGIAFLDRSTESMTIYRKNPDDPDGLSDSNIISMAEDELGNIWLAVSDGVNYFDRKTEKMKHYARKLGNFGPRGSQSIYVDRQHNTWVGTWAEGLYVYSKSTDKFSAIPTDASLAGVAEKNSPLLNDVTVWSFCELKDNSFWIGTHNAGVSRYDAATGVFSKYRSENTPTTLPNNIVWFCHEDRKGRFWMGTANGLSLMDRSTELFKNYPFKEGDDHSLKPGWVSDVFEDIQGRLWFATPKGLYLYRENTDDFEVYTTAQGFISDGITAIVGGKRGDLWLGTNSGLIQFNPDTLTVKNYTLHAGKKIGSVNKRAGFLSASGEVVFGTTDGLVIIDEDKLTTNKMPPPVVLSDFKVFARSIAPNDTEINLKSVINNVDTVTLGYTKSMFSFEFSALNYRSSAKNQYAYKLEGFDQDWREVGSARVAQYTNLSPGEYIFKVRASNNDGVWSDTPKSIRVIQLPPPWKTWWAYSIYALLSIITAAFLIFLQKQKQRNIEEQNRLLEIKVAERTRELAEKNRDIQALLGNMRQGLFTIEEGGIIHHEYSAYLESIFETKSIAGRDVLSLLFENALLSEDRVSQIESSLFSIIGSDEINYDLNAHLLISEFQLSSNGRVKILSLDWSPLIDTGDTVSKLMVSVRDVTELKVLEQEASIKKRELDIVSKLLSINNENYTHYIESSTRYIHENKQLIEQCVAFDQLIVAKLFRTIHTIKGNSRTHGFSHIANAAHEAESFYGQVYHLSIEQVREKLLLDLNAVAQAIGEYDRIYTQVLCRNENLQSNASGIWVSRMLVNSIQAKVEAIRHVAPVHYRSISGAINEVFSSSFAAVIKPVIDSLPALAEELGKQAPQVLINDSRVKILESAHNLLRDIFTHLLRNSIDHGIENTITRLAINKEPFGTITIALELLENTLYLTVSDDGRGLNLNRLYQKGRDEKLINDEQSLTRLDVANIIFASGLSTKENLSAISGRGVGMDAVKQFLIEFGGDIAIVIDEPAAPYIPSAGQECVSFVLCIHLPRDKCVAD